MLFVVLIGLCASISARGGVLKAPGEDLEVFLITYGPGDIYWERFGHDAIRIRDRVSGESGDINYGVFDFSDSAFMWNFARGHMRYMIDIRSSEVDQQDYIDADRSVLVQRLALSPQQAEGLRAFLLWNLQPENQSYDYDYLTSNCATRIRDALNTAFGGALQPALTSRRAPLTYRQQIDRLMAAQPWLMLLMDLGLGPSSDRPLNEWQESFLPMVLAREIRTVQVPDGHGGMQPVVNGEEEVSPNRLQPPGTLPPNLTWPLGVAGLLIGLAILLSKPRFPRLSAALSMAFLVVAGLLGTLLLGLWTLTIHYAAWANENLLLFNPVAFVIAAVVWRSRRAGGGRHLQVMLGIQLAAAVLALVIYLLPAFPQQNLPWLLFAIPIWLAITVTARNPAGALWPHLWRRP